MNTKSEFDSLAEDLIFIKSVNVHYWRSRRLKNTQSILMIPGWPVSSYSLLRIAKYLDKMMDVYVIDLPGYGGSDCDNNEFCGFEYYEKFIREFQDKIIKQDKIILFGYSTGGVHSLNYVYKYPFKTNKAILFSAPCDGIRHFEILNKKSPLSVKFLKSVQNSRKKELYIRVLDVYPIKTIVTLLVLFFIYTKKYPKLFKKENRDYLYNLIKGTSRFKVKAVYETAIEISQTDLYTIAEHIKEPVLILSAQNDTAVSPTRSFELRKKLKNGFYYIFPNGDHSIGMFDANKVAEIIQAFVRNDKDPIFS